MKMIKNLVCIVLSLSAILGFSLFGQTYAWVAFESENSIKFSLGELKFEFDDEVGFKTENDLSRSDEDGKYILPGDNLLNGIVKGTNKSTIAADLRLRIKYKYSDVENAAWSACVAESNILSADVADGWTFDETDSCWHKSLAKASGTDGDKFDIINSIYFSEATADDFSGKKVTVAYEIQAKQQDYVDWATISTDVAELSLV